MVNQPAFKVSLYDKTFRHLGRVGGYQSLTVTPRHNAIGTADLVVKLDHVRTPALMTDGVRAVIEYDGKFLMSGTIRTRQWQGPNNESMLTASITSDFVVLSEMLGWPSPSLALTHQGDEKTNYVLTGAAETVTKLIVKANAQRLGLPVTVATDRGRGKTIKISARMQALTDVLLPKVDQAGIGISVQQVDGRLVVDCYAPTVRARVLSEASGVIVEWSGSKTDGVLTRVVVGGGGAGKARAFQLVVDAALEAQMGRVAEGFVDARDLGGDYNDAIANTPVTLAAKNRAEDALDRAQSKYDVMQGIKNSAALAVVNADPGAQTTAATPILADANAALNAADSARVAATTALNAATAAYNTAVALEASLKTQYNQDLNDRGTEALAAAAASYGFSVTLAETTTFKYGRTLVIGDVVTESIAGVPVVDVCREVTISDTTDNGLEVVPTVGSGDSSSADDPNSIVISAVSRIGKAIRTNGSI